MRGVASLFMVTGILAVLIGMVFGVYMSAGGDHSLAPAHAHLNLLGWVSFAIYALYYHAVPRAGEGGLARFHYIVALAGLVTITPGIVLAIQERGDLLAMIGTMLTILGTLLFLVIVLRSRVRMA